MTVRLRNTLTRNVEPVEPLEAGRVRMYSCGPTVYRYAHVGNLRSYLRVIARRCRRVIAGERSGAPIEVRHDACRDEGRATQTSQCC